MTTTLRPHVPAHSVEHMLDAEPAVVRGFSRAVADALDHGSFSLADRDRLIARGVRLGLKRFDANLLIAIAERRRRTRPELRLVTHRYPPVTTKLPRWAAWCTVAILQFAIAASAWWVVS